LWNLVRLANALFPLAPEKEKFQEVLHQFQKAYPTAYLTMMSEKLGLQNVQNTSSPNASLIAELEQVLQLTETDMTIFFRNLGNFKKDVDLTEGNDFIKIIEDAFYDSAEIDGTQNNPNTQNTLLSRWKNWFILYQNHLSQASISDEQRKAKMNKVNPKYVLRNYMAQLAIEAADKGDYSIVGELYELLKKPYQEQPDGQDIKWVVLCCLVVLNYSNYNIFPLLLIKSFVCLISSIMASSL